MPDGRHSFMANVNHKGTPISSNCLLCGLPQSASAHQGDNLPATPKRSWTSAEDYCYLCCNCGGIAPADQFGAFVVADQDEGPDSGWVPAPPGESDPMIRCPMCGWEHTDDDSNPGLGGGTRTAMLAERERERPDMGDLWEHVATELATASTSGRRQADA